MSLLTEEITAARNRKNIRRSLSEEPEQKPNNRADTEAADPREIEPEILFLHVDVARQAPQRDTRQQVLEGPELVPKGDGQPGKEKRCSEYEKEPPQVPYCFRLG